MTKDDQIKLLQSALRSIAVFVNRWSGAHSKPSQIITLALKATGGELPEFYQSQIKSNNQKPLNILCDTCINFECNIRGEEFIEGSSCNYIKETINE